jgi:type IV fimbrial biogenesis protein FimT
MHNKTGFSLIELLITVVLISIISILAIPNFQSFFKQSQSKTLATQLMEALHLTRSEAMLRGITITLCQSADHTTCSGNWQDGQIIFADTKNTATVENKESLLYVFPSSRQKGILHWRSSLHRNYLSFYPTGFTRSEDGTFWYCQTGKHQATWAVIVNQAGRARYVDNAKNLVAYLCE